MNIIKQDYKDAIYIFHALKDKCKDLIVSSWERNRATIQDINIYKDDNGKEMLNICFDYYCCGETDYEEDNVPFDWLFLSDEDLDKARTEEAEKRRRAEIEAEKKRKLEYQKEKERKEREQYKRLKAKYEN